MGDPRKRRKKYSTSVHPWNKVEIDRNKLLRREYGLRIRKELLIADSFLKKYKNMAKSLIANETVQGEKEKNQMLDKLQRLGLLSEGVGLDSVLSIEIKDVLERRLQSVICRKSLARTMKQARQFITHRHIVVGDKEITAPSYLVSTEEENKLGFKGKSGLASEDHPERAIPVQEIKEEAEAVKPKKEAAKKETKEAKKDEKVSKKKVADTKKEVKTKEKSAEETKETKVEEAKVEETEVKAEEVAEK
jgi:small subunit ribosomal protein S4